MNVNEGYYCGKCKYKYSTRQNWASHFTYQKVKSQHTGVSNRIANICYKTNGPKVCDTNLEKAIRKYEQELQHRQASKLTFIPSPELPFVSIRDKHQIPIRENTVTVKKIKTAEPATNPVPLQPIATHAALGKEQEPDTIAHESEGAGVVDKLAKLFKEQQLQTNLIRQIHDKVITDAKSTPQTTSTCKNKVKLCTKSEDFNVNIICLKASKSMNDILNNPLIKSVFKLLDTPLPEIQQSQLPEEVIRALAGDDIIIPDETPEEHGVNEVEEDNDDNDEDNCEIKHHMYCIPCSDIKILTAKGKCRPVFTVKDPSYSSIDNPKGVRMEKWFSNLKTSLQTHLQRLQHHQRVVSYEVINNYNLNNVRHVTQICSNILYYMVKTNSPMAMYPVLLAVVYRSGYQVGNLNHSSYSYELMINLIDDQLKQQNTEWFSNQNQ